IGKFEEGQTLYDRALELDPNSAIIMRDRAVSLEVLGRFDEARTQREQLVEKAPLSPIGHVSMGQYHYYISGQLDEAARWFQQLTLIDADTPNFNFFH
ncbi:MAG: tetratricopeptide repeat protein, partial [Gammaproteobacteria bacterium]|nr:tetratricopeptide repeat protein [Gammaproteobacteria bacterium]